MTIDWQISIGNLVTAASVLISAVALAYGWCKDRLPRPKEYADRIRSAAGNIAAKLERWQTLVLGFFDDVELLAVRIVGQVAGGTDRAAARHGLWQELHE